MNKKQAKVASILSLIAGIIFTILGVIMVTAFFISDETVHGVDLLFSILFVGIPLITGIIGLYMSKKVKQNPTTTDGIILIMCGVVTFILGVSILFILAGIFTILAKNNSSSETN